MGGSIAPWPILLPPYPPTHEPDYISNSNSRYVYTPKGVYRHSDHWGIVSSCQWTLNGKIGKIVGWGYCPWEKFARTVSISPGLGGQDLAIGDNVRIIHSPKDRRGNPNPIVVVIVVSKITPDYVVDMGGKRYAKSTLCHGRYVATKKFSK